MTSRPSHLDTLTGLRFLAALLVFSFHLPELFIGTPAEESVARAGRYGNTGVMFFFVLSGFVLAWVHPRVTDRRAFYVRRFARIWPAHAVAWIIALGLSLMSIGSAVRFDGAILSLFLLQGWTTDRTVNLAVNGPAWSLSCEVFFYALFPLAVVLVARSNARTRRLIMVGALAVAVVVAVVSKSPNAPSWGPWLGYFSPIGRFPEFVLGICLAFEIIEGRRLRIPMVVVLAALAATMGALTFGPPLPAASYIVLLPLFALLIVTAASADLRGVHAPSHRLVVLGQWSFGFYLLHQGIIKAQAGLMEEMIGPYGTGVAVAATMTALIASIAAAAALHHVVERPAQRRISSAADKRTVSHAAARTRS